MKMKIKKQNLLRALEIVKPGLAGKEMIEQSTSFAFIGGSVVTYNDEISIAHPVENLDLSGAVRSKELYEFLNKTSKDEISIEVSDNEILLKAGRAKAGLRLQTEIVLPLGEIELANDWVRLPKDLASAIQFVVESCSRDLSRPVLTCVHITENIAEASDGFQIVKFKLTDAFGEDMDILLPSSSARELVKIEPTHISITSEWLHFKNENETMFSCRVFNEDYPDTAKHMKVKGDKVVFPKRMIEILGRAMVFTKQEHQIDETVEISFSDGLLTVNGKNEYAWFQEETKVKYKGDAVAFQISPTLLSAILSKSNTATISSDRIKFKGDNWEYVAALQNNS